MERGFDEESDRLLEELQDMGIELEVHFRMLDRQLRMACDSIMSEQAEAHRALEAAEANAVDDDALDPGDHDPLTLKQALCLPELGGILRRNLEDSVPSTTVFRKTLYKAVRKGVLVVMKLSETEFKVTRHEIRAWLERCTVQPDGSHAPQRKSVRKFKSKEAPPMSEATMAKSAVELMLEKLRKGT